MGHRFKYLFLLLGIFTSGSAFGALTYLPAGFQGEKARILVVIHGCLQSAESMALGTGWNQLADRHNLAILYPQVPEGSNPLGCWNWYEAENQNTKGGQLKLIVDQVADFRSRFGIKRKKFYAVGISSGGATVAGLMACYPHLLEGGAIHSGPSYGLARSLDEADRVLKNGPEGVANKGPCRPRDFKGALMVIQGGKDTVVHPSHAARIVSDFLGSSQPFQVEALKEGNVTYDVSNFRSERGPVARMVVINELGHAWSGFASNLRHSALLGPSSTIPTKVPFFIEYGPSATNLIWDFFASLVPSK